MSRQDNPYISQRLELLSNCGDSEMIRTVSPISFVDTLSDSNEASQSLLSIQDMDEIHQLDQTDLHEHLIRSPPPQFPQKFSHFVFPGPESPLRSMPLKRPPIMKAASESAAMSLSIPQMSEQTEPTDSNIQGMSNQHRHRLLRRASAGGQMETDLLPSHTQTIHGFTDCFGENRFLSMNLPPLLSSSDGRDRVGGGHAASFVAAPTSVSVSAHHRLGSESREALLSDSTPRSEGGEMSDLWQ